MGNNLFSDSFSKTHLATCNSVIQNAIIELQAVLHLSNPAIYDYKEYIAMSFLLAVNLPSRGTVNNIDIRQNEPLLIFFHKTDFPGKAPQIRIDRRDFPVEELPHLNPVWEDDPYWPCLHRGSIDDWFAEHSISNLIDRAQKWFEDAAMGHLIKEKDRYEPTRLSGGYSIGGISIFSHKLFSDYVENSWRKNPQTDFAYTASYGSITNDQFEWFRFLSDFIAPSLSEVVSHYETEQKRQTFLVKGSLFPGILIWPNKDYICKKYFGILPKTIQELNNFATEIGLNVKDALSTLLGGGVNEKKGVIPIFLCIQRPLKLINSDSSFEFLSFIYSKTESEMLLITPQREPLTTSFARKLSNLKLNMPTKVCLIGCGALGSKIGLHLGRAGITDLTLIDYDTLSPHNLVRHALLANFVGVNKAKGLEWTIRATYQDGSESIKISTLTKNVYGLINGDQTVFKGIKLIVDATASTSVLELLSSRSNPYQIPVIRCEIADAGHLGIMMIEGRGQSPNIGDLRASLYDQALEDVRIENWLTSFRNQNNEDLNADLEDITVGLGCSSPTMKVPDDLVSFHASAQAMTIRRLLSDENHAAGIQISHIKDGKYPEVSSFYIPVEKYKTLVAKQIKGWGIRIRVSLYESLLQCAKEAVPNETGGILVGFINFKQKIIYVTRDIKPPVDSIGWPYAFKLGVKDIPEQLKPIMEKTGNLIRYVGEWHSHPIGSNRLSVTDHEAIKQLNKNISRIGMPTFTLIVTNTGCYPYIF